MMIATYSFVQNAHNFVCIFVYYVNGILGLKGVYLAYKLRKGLHGSKGKKIWKRQILKNGLKIN